MAIFGSKRDINFFKSISRELIEDIVSTQCGYYKVILNQTKPNVYGEAISKYYMGPVLLNCLIQREDFTAASSDFGVDYNRDVTFRFLKDHLVDANVVPESGDVIMYNELYYEVDGVNENQLIMGKDSDYAYSQGLDNFGASFSIICSTHFTSPDRLGITKQRL
jgi:hypothetical protein